jgi:hypothetical protein
VKKKEKKNIKKECLVFGITNSIENLSKVITENNPIDLATWTHLVTMIWTVSEKNKEDKGLEKLK